MARKPTYEELDQRVRELEKEAVERKRAEEEIQTLRDKFEGVLSAIGDGVDITTYDYRVVYANDNLKKIIGKDELEGNLCYEVFLERDAPCERCPMRRAIKTGKTETEEILQPNGRIVELSSSPLRLSSGEMAAIEIAKDITEHKSVEKALKEKEELYRTFINSTSDMVFVKDEQLRHIVVNKALLEYMGAEEDQVIGKNDFELLPAPIAEKCRQTDMKALESGNVVISEEPIGEKIFETRKFRVKLEDNKFGIGVYIRDITMRKQAEETLQKAHDELEQRVEERTFELATRNKQLELEIARRKQAEETIKRRLEFEKTVSTISSRFINVSDFNEAINISLCETGRLSGADRAYLFLLRQEKAIMDNTHEWCAEGVSSEIDNLKNLPSDMVPWWMGKLQKGEVIHIKDVSEMPAEAKAEKEILERQNIKSLLVLPVHVKGEVDGFIGFDNVKGIGGWTDDDLAILRISSELIGNALERKRAEESLRESEKHYRETLDAMGDWILAVDQDLRILLSNAAFIQMNKELGLTTDVIGRTPMEIFPFLQPTLIDEYRWVFENKKVIITEENTKIGDREFITESRKIPLLREGEIVKIVSVIRDITELKRLEAQLQQAQRMEAIGTLAGGIAHDFNNLLTVILGNTSLMLLGINSSHTHYVSLKSIEKQVQSGVHLTNKLLGYARKGRYEVIPFDLNQLVEETSDTFGRTRKEITIQRILAEDLRAIEADKVQIEQVLLNLYINAADAMPRGGDLILKTRNTSHEDMKGMVYDAKSGNYVLLMVTDTGEGMDKETQKRIFDPFFTTKEIGRGTGLGLASVYGIVKSHGGYIDVKSEKGQGSTFSIYLPAINKRVQKVESVKTPEQIIEGTGTVLLIDDEEVIREVGRKLLEVMGYSVLIARDGKEAVDVYKKNWADIDFVILDMVMPNMDGGEAYDRIKEINPNIKVLLSSGYSIDGEATEIMKRGCNGFIQKPFDLKELSGKIRKILGKE